MNQYFLYKFRSIFTFSFSKLFCVKLIIHVWYNMNAYCKNIIQKYIIIYSMGYSI